MEDRAIQLFIDYEYNCEMFDRSIEKQQIYDEHGYVRLLSSNSLGISQMYANRQMHFLQQAFESENIDGERYKNAKQYVSRLTFKGLEEFYLLQHTD